MQPYLYRFFAFIALPLYCIPHCNVVYAAPPLSHPTTSSYAPLHSTLTQLIRLGQYKEAFTLANQQVAEFGGDPNFDFILGVAALKAGEYQHAVFAFERVLIIKPKEEVARFNLATAYFHIDNFAAAKRELQILSLSTKEPYLITGARKYTALIERIENSRRRSLKNIVGISAGYDSNINSGSTIDDFIHPLLTQRIQLSEDGKETSDTATYFNYQLHYKDTINQQRLLLGSIVVSHTDYHEHKNKQFQNSAAQITGRIQDEWADGRPFQVGVYYGSLWLDDSLYRKQYGVDANTRWSIAKPLMVAVQASLGKSSNTVNKALDSIDTSLGINAQHHRGRWLNQLSANYSDIRTTQSNSEHNAYHVFLLQYQTGYTLTKHQQIMLNIQSLHYSYQDVHPFWLQTRADELLRTGFSWRYITDNGFVWTINAKHSNKESNIPLYQYRKNDFSLGFSTVF